MAIQHKDCPRCATTVGNYITRCECGYSFDDLGDAEPTQRLETMAEEERLYEDYLAARAKQAIAEAADARAGVLNAPDNYYWVTQVEQTETVRDALMAELYRQKLRNSELSCAIEQAKSYSKKKVVVLNPIKSKSQERPRSIVPPPSTPPISSVKSNDIHADNKPKVPTVSTAADQISQTNGTTAVAVTDNKPSPAVASQTKILEAALVLAASTDKPSTEVNEISAYTAKLEEILSANQHPASPVPAVVTTTRPLAAPEAPPQSSQLLVALQKAASAIVAIDAKPVTVEILGNTPPPVLRPEERLEHDSKAIRARAVAMAERLCGTPVADLQDFSSAKSIGRAVTQPIGNHAAQPKPPELPVTSSVPPEIKPAVAVKATDSTEVKQKKKNTRVESTQIHTKHPSRPTRVPRAKQEQARRLEDIPTPPVPEPYIEDRPSAMFRAMQFARAEKIAEEARAANNSAEVNHCPFCSATHSGHTERCGCGYIFEKPTDLPELVLSSKERIELLEDGIQIKRPKSSR